MPQVTLSEFIRGRRAEILGEWEAGVRALPPAPDLDRPTLVDSIPSILDRIAELTEHFVSGAEPPADLVDLPAAREDGGALVQIIDEFAILRECITRMWERDASNTVELRELRHFDQAIDHILLASVERYTQARDRTDEALDAIASAALESKNLDELLNRLLQILLATTDTVDTAAILILDDGVLRVRAAVGLDPDLERGFPVPVGMGFAGAVAKSGAAGSLGFGTSDVPVLSKVLREAGLQTLYGVPLIEGDNVFGVAHMGSLTAREFSKEDKRLFTVMAARATSAIYQHVLREAADRRSEEQHFLAEASKILSSSLDYHVTLDAIARLAVPVLGDWCVVDIVEERGSPRRVALAHSDPERIAFAERWMRDHPLDWDAKTGAANVIRTGEYDLLPEVTDEEMAARFSDPELLVAVLELGMKSLLIVPIVSPDHVLGAITFVMTESERRYTTYDVELGRELGRRAGNAIENARHFRDAHRAIHQRENLLAIVSHDLRNPLGAIDLNAALLLERRPEPRARKSLEIIRRSAQHMEHLIDDLLDMSRIQSGTLTLDARPEDAAQIVADVLDVHEPVAVERHIALVRESAAPDVHVVCDRERIGQVLSNLVGNAIKFCQPGDRIVVRTSTDHDWVHFAISDTGPGIPEADLPHIFEPYWSGSQHVKLGTGLGLFICKGIVEAHHGSLTVDSKLGHGATFTVTLPIAGAEPKRAA